MPLFAKQMLICLFCEMFHIYVTFLLDEWQSNGCANVCRNSHGNKPNRKKTHTHAEVKTLRHRRRRQGFFYCIFGGCSLLVLHFNNV